MHHHHTHHTHTHTQTRTHTHTHTHTHRRRTSRIVGKAFSGNSHSKDAIMHPPPVPPAATTTTHTHTHTVTHTHTQSVTHTRTSPSLNRAMHTVAAHTSSRLKSSSTNSIKGRVAITIRPAGATLASWWSPPTDLISAMQSITTTVCVKLYEHTAVQNISAWSSRKSDVRVIRPLI